MAQGIYIQDEIANYTPNVLPYSSTFDNAVSITKVSGASTATANYTTKFAFDGVKSILAFNQSTATALNFNLGTALEKTLNNTGNYIVSLRLLHENNTVYTDKITLKITVNGVASFYTMDCQFTADMVKNQQQEFQAEEKIGKANLKSAEKSLDKARDNLKDAEKTIKSENKEHSKSKRQYSR
jgi:hypothetical protein